MNLGGGVEKSPNIQYNPLVLSIDQNGRIVFFNKECEKIVGYSKNEVLDKKIFDLLIPDHHRDQWEKIFNSVSQNQLTDNFELPWLTRDGNLIMANWTIAPVSDSDSKVGDFGLIGNVMSLVDKDEVSKFRELKYKDISKNENDSDYHKRKINNEKYLLFSFNNKQLVFRKKPSSSKAKNFTDLLKYKHFSKTHKPQHNIKKDTPNEEDNNSNAKKLGKIKRKKGKRKSDKSTKAMEKLREENKKLKDEIKKLKTKKSNNIKKPIELFQNSVYFILDAIGGKKKKEEFDNMMKKLDEQKIVLNDLESQLNKDKLSINRSRNDFIKWREKLELLEKEIVKQEKDLALKKEKVRKNLLFFMDEDTKKETNALNEGSFISEVDKDGELDHHKLLDEIPNSAAIIQRGILKHVNKSLVELLGYSSDTLLEKNLLDFVTPEGISGIENYYLKRLKGDEVNTFDTVIQTKDDNIIRVEVSTKPVMFNNEKADIAVFKESIYRSNDNIATSDNDMMEDKEKENKINSEEKTQEKPDIVNDDIKSEPNLSYDLDNSNNKKDNNTIQDGHNFTESDNVVDANIDNEKRNETIDLKEDENESENIDVMDKSEKLKNETENDANNKVELKENNHDNKNASAGIKDKTETNSESDKINKAETDALLKKIKKNYE